MKYCKKCLTTDLRPNASFNNGICIACCYSELENDSNSALTLKILQKKIQKSDLDSNDKCITATPYFMHDYDYYSENANTEVGQRHINGSVRKH
jgi:hypothetical protein